MMELGDESKMKQDPEKCPQCNAPRLSKDPKGTWQYACECNKKTMAKLLGMKLNEVIQKSESKSEPKVYWHTIWILKSGVKIDLWSKDVVPENECPSNVFVQFIGLTDSPDVSMSIEKQVLIWTDEVAAMESTKHLIFDEAAKNPTEGRKDNLSRLDKQLTKEAEAKSGKCNHPPGMVCGVCNPKCNYETAENPKEKGLTEAVEITEMMKQRRDGKLCSATHGCEAAITSINAQRNDETTQRRCADRVRSLSGIASPASGAARRRVQ